MAVERATSWAARTLGPGGQTLLLTVLIAAAGLAAFTSLPSGSLLPSPVGWPGLVVLFAVLLATEMRQVHIEVRRHAHSFSLTSAPLAVGLLYCSPDVLVAVRLTAAAVAFALQRMRPTKVAFNLAGYFLDVCLLVLLAHLLSGPAPVLDGLLALVVYAAMTICEIVAACLVLLVIRIHTGPLSAADLAEALITSAVFVVVCAAGALSAALLLERGVLGWALLALLGSLAFASYRMQAAARRRQASMEVVKAFVELGAQTAAESGDLGQVLLGKMRQVVRGERAAILLPVDEADGGGWAVQNRVQEDGTEPVAHRIGRRAQDAVLAEAALTTTPRLIRRNSPDRADAAFLAGHDLREAMVCPIDLGERRGIVIVADRLGETSTFSKHDLALLETLTGHLAVALRSAWLLEKLRHDATHDPLTGLANLAGLRARAEELAGSVEKEDDDDGGGAPATATAVLAITLERAGEVNTVLGHHAGEELLVRVARRLEHTLPEATIARVGGEEFAVLLTPPTDQPPLVHALAAASLLEQVVAEPVQLTSATVSTSAGIGVAVAEPGEGLGDVLRRADTARTAAPPGSRGPVAYTASMDEGRAERVGLLADLHRALEDEELALHYQPKLDLAFGLVTSVESLVRWDHPRLGRLSPDTFVPLAESTALIEPFTHHLLGKALHQARRWQDQGIDLSVAVNLSARNVVDPELPEKVAAALAVAGVPASRLTLEMTESSMVEDPRRTIEVLERLAAIGVTISLDDFGTGYSSLSYLQRLPVRELKIDRSFVRGLEATHSPENVAVSAALIRSITALKDALGLRVVAEGVEDHHVLEQLRDLGVDLIQGYVISRPMPADHLDSSMFRWHTTDNTSQTNPRSVGTA
ncbi:diguanylate cyclase/phosphodiesterase [Quadrisphaera granulorum]|uniref:Diguanylate cyclase/phosphodiesterase n=1 Tax=Quadrisphaera granulorum TaxID=317664 RepID=A0A316A667_9ACTN|nr:EAL domain-containing protein [Quadrisphaera granulorum]PWJ53009.1 diguanylate cyclase/phosphodiesterase [Quadrisphaera granulorum]SZE97174.1 diguanylate cyclase/phosphodiesterase [Quadrisphaera granulorum]